MAGTMIEYKTDRVQRTYGNLCVCRLTAEQREKTCGYWYTVTDNAMALTAFRSRKALDLWMQERHLEFVPGEDHRLEDGYEGWAIAHIRNAYTDICHRTSATMPPTGQPKMCGFWTMVDSQRRLGPSLTATYTFTT